MSLVTPQAVGPVVLATHSTRHTPRCIECVHYRAKEKCNHPSTAVDIITGQPVMSVYAMRTTHTPVLTADAPVRCTPAGVLFEANDAPPTEPKAPWPGAMVEMAPCTVDPFSSPWALPKAPHRTYPQPPENYGGTGE